MILLTYGQPKSASTFLSFVAKRACEMKGCDQDTIKARVMTGDLSENKKYWFAPIARIADVADRVNPDEYLLIKTHGLFTKELVPGIQSGRIRPFITYRTPGDAALSAFESGEKARRPGHEMPRQDFYKLYTHRDAIDLMVNHINVTTIPWLKSGYGTAFSYEEITTDPQRLLQVMAQALEIDEARIMADPKIQALISGKTRVYNFNKGISGRHKEIFSQEDLEYLEARCGPFIRFCNGEITAAEL